MSQQKNITDLTNQELKDEYEFADSREMPWYEVDPLIKEMERRAGSAERFYKMMEEFHGLFANSKNFVDITNPKIQNALECYQKLRDLQISIGNTVCKASDLVKVLPKDHNKAELRKTVSILRNLSKIQSRIIALSQPKLEEE